MSRAPHDGEGMAVSVKVFPAVRAGGATHLALEAPQVFQPGLGATGMPFVPVSLQSQPQPAMTEVCVCDFENS